MMLIRLLGLVAVGRDETLLQPVQGQVKSAVLAVLAKSEGRIVTVDTLIDAVWEAAPRSARNSVQVAVSQLRQMIGSDLIQGDRIGYTLRTGLLRVDLQEVEQLITDANQLIAVADWRAVEKTSARGLKFFDGTPLPGVRAPIAESLRQWASERRFGLLMTHARSLVELGRTAEAVTELGELATAHSLDDAIHRLLLRALALDGHPAAALDVYERFRRRLREELGTDPAPETDAEFQRLLKQEWTAPAAADVSTLIRSSAPRVRCRWPRWPSPLVGRDDDVAYIAGLIGRGHRLVTVVGTGGIGKTRVVVGVAHHVTERTDRPVVFVNLH